jgi:pimeloyl-ACP methyl ester carboxylesterase
MQDLILLHGAIGASEQLSPLSAILNDHYRTFKPDFNGHGGNPFNNEDFTIQGFAREVLDHMDQNSIDRAHIVGYSMGGYVGMYLAAHFPDKIRSVVTLATKYQWDEAIADREIRMLNPDKITQKVPEFAEQLKKRHAPNDWKILLEKTQGLLRGLGQKNALTMEDFHGIQAESLLLLGDQDKMVTIEETVTTFRQLPNARLGVLPGTPHPIEQVDTQVLATMILSFLE